MKAVDLFCGAGGLSLGLEKAGITSVAAFDSWKAATDTYNANHVSAHAHHCDLSDVNRAVAGIRWFAGTPDLIAGGPPCTDFSAAGSRIEGTRADLTLAYARICDAVRPRWTLMENVPLALKSEAFTHARSVLKEAGYGLTIRVLDASFCGVPQARTRLFCIGLQGAADGFLDDELSANLDEKPMTLGRWSLEQGIELPFEHYYRHPRTYGRRAVFGIHEPAPTMRGVNRPVPPTYKDHTGDPVSAHTIRALTPAERAMIQGFPSDYVWPVKGGKSTIEQMVGNAVPVGLGAYVGRAIMAHEAKIKLEMAHDDIGEQTVLPTEPDIAE